MKPTVIRSTKEDKLVSIKIYDPSTKTVELSFTRKHLKNPNVVKAVVHLGGYAENKGLLNEVVKTLDWLDSFNNEKNGGV